jgi:hypothetical protein
METLRSELSAQQDGLCRFEEATAYANHKRNLFVAHLPCNCLKASMSQAAVGSKLDEMPAGTEFLIFRQTAAEARLIGFLARNFITDDWRNRVEALDYADLMLVDDRVSAMEGGM